MPSHTSAYRRSEFGTKFKIGTLAYTYIHLPIVAGIIVAAAADELVLAHPTGHTGVETMAAALGGSALYLVGNMLFKQATANRVPLSHLVGLLLLVSLIPLSSVASPLVLATATALVLVLVAAWEWISLGRGPSAAFNA